MSNPNVVINGQTYNGVPKVDIPIYNGNGAEAEFYYTGDDDAVAGNVLYGKKCHGASGLITGEMANNGSTSGTISTKAGTVNVPAGYTSGGTVSIDSTEQAKITAGNIKSGVTILGVEGSMTAASISQDQDGVLTIS